MHHKTEGDFNISNENRGVGPHQTSRTKMNSSKSGVKKLCQEARRSLEPCSSEETLKRIGEYLALSPQKRAALTRHIRTCESCGEYTELRFNQGIDALRQMIAIRMVVKNKKNLTDLPRLMLERGVYGKAQDELLLEAGLTSEEVAEYHQQEIKLEEDIRENKN